MAAPVALSGSGRNAVRVGMSFGSLPKAPGAPSGQSGMGAAGSDCANTVPWPRAKRPRLKKTIVFMAPNVTKTGPTQQWLLFRPDQIGVAVTAVILFVP